MLFNSYTYLLLFLPLSWAGFNRLQRHNRQEAALLWLNACSLAFYSWWNPAYLPLLLFSVLGNFQLGKVLTRHSGSATGRRWLTLGISLNLGALAYFKYTAFALGSINAFLGTHYHDPGIVLPLAISFFTFNQIAWLVDAYEGMAEEYRLNHYALFVTFFPHLLAGPIVHHRELIPQFLQQQDSTVRQAQHALGITAIAFGLFKKVILADTLGSYASQLFNGAANGASYSATDAWIGTLSFTLQVYFDFSGYCDIACGSALLFGITLPQNFVSPFKSPNIIEYWKRWHITLSRFITSYVYTPLMRNTPGGIVFSKAMLVTLISMGISGLWHGAGWTFILWGLSHGVLLVINHSWRKLPVAKQLATKKSWQLFSILLTYLMVMMTMVLFRSDNLHTALGIYQHLFDPSSLHLTHQVQQPVISDLCRQLGLELSPLQKIFPVLLFMQAWVWFLPSMQQVMGRDYALNNIRLPATRWAWKANQRWSLLAALAFTVSLMALYETGEFVYFQF